MNLGKKIISFLVEETRVRFAFKRVAPFVCEPYAALGVLAHLSRDYDEAIAAFNTALDINPQVGEGRAMAGDEGSARVRARARERSGREDYGLFLIFWFFLGRGWGRRWAKQIQRIIRTQDAHQTCMHSKPAPNTHQRHHKNT